MPIPGKGASDVTMSISGQNERWAQLNAYQPPPSSQYGQNGGFDPISLATASSGATGNATAAAPALSDDMSLALMAFAGWGNGSAPASQATGQNTAASSTQAGSIASQLLSVMQSLTSALTGAATGAPAASGTTTGLVNTAAQDLQTITADLGTIVPVSGSAQPGQPEGPPPSDNTIPNTGTGTTRGWNPDYSDGIQQQFAAAAYSANAMTGLDSSATSALTNITV
jgi:hypothetical protein